MLQLLHRSIWHVALAMLAVVTMPAIAQERPPLQQQASPPADASAERPGLFDGLGKILKSPGDLLPSFPSLSKPEAAPKPEAVPQPPVAATVPPSAAPPPQVAAPAAPPPVVEPPPVATSTRLFPGMVSGREVCPRAPNGAPDCQTGTDKLCQSRGYKSGKSLNTDSSFSCSSRQARAEGRKPCGTEYFVTSAFCQ